MFPRLPKILLFLIPLVVLASLIVWLTARNGGRSTASGRPGPSPAPSHPVAPPPSTNATAVVPGAGNTAPVVGGATTTANPGTTTAATQPATPPPNPGSPAGPAAPSSGATPTTTPSSRIAQLAEQAVRLAASGTMPTDGLEYFTVFNSVRRTLSTRGGDFSRRESRESMAAMVETLTAASRAEVERIAAQRQIAVVETRPDGGTRRLMGFDDTDAPVYAEAQNLNSAYQSAANFLRDDPVMAFVSGTRQMIPNTQFATRLDGDGIAVAICDASTTTLHVDLVNDADGRRRMFRYNFAQDSAAHATDMRHATHVVGTILSSGVNQPTTLGVAPKASAKVWAGFNTLSMGWSLGMAWPGEPGKVLLSNASIGWASGNWSSYWNASSPGDTGDEMAVAMPYYLAFVAAGNSGSSGIYPSIGGYHGTAKNVMHVGNLRRDGGQKFWERNEFGVNPDLQIHFTSILASLTTGSSRGPLLDGRIKPDFCDYGNGVISTVGTTGIDGNTGTSMATPGAVGSSALLQEYFQERFGSFMRASTLVALLKHTAEEVRRSQNRTTQFPDYTYGYGLINVLEAAKIIRAYADSARSRRLNEIVLKSGETHLIPVVAKGGEPLKATISWTDPVAEHQANQFVLVNDLNLRVVAPNNTETLPWTTEYVVNYVLTGTFNPDDKPKGSVRANNPVDNTEHILVPAASVTAGQTYTIKVSHNGPLTHGEQIYSLVISGMAENSGELSTPQISAAQPDHEYGSGIQTLEILGGEFMLGASVRFVRDGHDPVPLFGVEIRDDKILARYRRTALAPGTWNLEVTNPDGQSATLSNALVLNSTHVAIYQADMTDNPGWTLGGAAGWMIGDEMLSGIDGSPVISLSGTGLPAAGTHTASFGPFSLAEMDAAELWFQGALKFSATSSFLTQWSPDGVNWKTIPETVRYNSAGDNASFTSRYFQMRRFDFPHEALGQPAVYVRFVFNANGTHTFGNFSCSIDNMYIEGRNDPGPLPEYSTLANWDMNSAPEGWTFDPPWEYGVPDKTNVSSGFDGPQALATTLVGTPPGLMSDIAWATSPAIDTTGVDEVFVDYYHFLKLQVPQVVRVEWSPDGGTTWNTVRWLEGASVNAWTADRIALPATAAGTPNLHLRFGYLCTGSNTRDGWLLDNITVTALDHAWPHARIDLPAPERLLLRPGNGLVLSGTVLGGTSPLLQWTNPPGSNTASFLAPGLSTTEVTFPGNGFYDIAFTAVDALGVTTQDTLSVAVGDVDYNALANLQLRFESSVSGKLTDHAGGTTATITEYTSGLAPHPAPVFGPGRDGNALYFDGVNDRVVTDHKITIDPEKPFTVAMWVKIDAAATSIDRTILTPENGEPWLMVKNGSRFVHGSVNPILDAGGYKDHWIHIAFAREAGAVAEVRFYQNGTLVGRLPRSLAYQVTRLIIGASNAYGGLGTNHFHGWIDDLKIFPVALGDSEIRSLAMETPADAQLGVAIALPETVQSGAEVSAALVGSLNPSAQWLWSFPLGANGASLATPEAATSLITGLNGGGTWTLRALAKQPGLHLFSEATFDVLALDTLENWAAGMGHPPGSRGPDADPDGNGFTNLQEFALRHGLPSMEVPAPVTMEDSESGPDILRVGYQRRAGGTETAPGEYVAGELTYRIEASTTLAGNSWTTDLASLGVSPAPAGTTTDPLPEAAGWENAFAHLQVPPDAPKLFFRVKVSYASTP